MFVSVRGKVFSDSTGTYTEIPVLLTPEGVLEPLVSYFESHSHDRSLKWMTKTIRSVRMFLEYVQANQDEHENYRLFQNFAHRLYTGTFEHETGLDPSCLCWKSLSPKEASAILTHLTDFFNWMGVMHSEAKLINPRYTGGRYDQMMDRLAYLYRRNKAFLGHSWATNAGSTINKGVVRSLRPPKVEESAPPAFPESRFVELLEKGFRVGTRYDYRGMLITLLLHGAGFRESEPFHLYIEDVVPEPERPNQANVRIHHPHFGASPKNWKEMRNVPGHKNRFDYLAHEFGLAPRTKMMGSRHAGWKGGMHDGPYYKQAYWFEPEYGERFMHIWHRYLEQVARIERSHPFAFINLKGDVIGDMYTVAQFNKAHAAACNRIGLIVGKHIGTTPHGHRHAYGRRLKGAGFDQLLIRKLMHHSAIESQEVYTKSSIQETQRILVRAAENLRSKDLSEIPDLDNYLGTQKLNIVGTS